MTRICPVCGANALREVQGDYTHEWPDGTNTVFQQACWEACDSCEEMLIPNALGERIERQRYLHEGLLPPDEIKAIREKLSISQVEMAQFMGVGDKTYARWETGASMQNKSTDTLIRIASEHPEWFIETEAKRNRLDRQQIVAAWFDRLKENHLQDEAIIAFHGNQPSSERSRAIRERLRILIREQSE